MWPGKCAGTLRMYTSHATFFSIRHNVIPPGKNWKRLCNARELKTWLGVRQTRVERRNDVDLRVRACSRTVQVECCRFRSSSAATEFSVSSNIGGSEMKFSSGKVALLADGAAVVQSGNTCVLVTAVSSKSPSSGQGIPLQVEYRERAAAAGRIPHNFLKREMRISEKEVLVCRFIDRSIRPLFPKGFSYDTQVICSMLAVDGRNDPEVMSINGASAALILSDIPWNGPVAAVRVGLIDGKFHLNPTARELDSSCLNLIVTTTEDNFVMVEGVAHEVAEETFCDAILYAHQEARPLLATLNNLKQERGKAPRPLRLQLPSSELEEHIWNECGDGVRAILSDSSHKKLSRDNALRALLAAAANKLSLSSKDGSSHIPPSSLITSTFWSMCGQQLQALALENGLRCDGRGLDDLRPISCEVDLLPPLHGSSLFKRGETQVFCTVTFDSPESAAQADLVSMILGSQKYKRFMVQYEFPPFSNNEIGPFLMPGRREVGHGALAEKAFLPVLPPEFPFTIRVTSQVLDSNGSSSMATVCGTSLALYDAGVPISRPVAGVASGLVTRKDADTDRILEYKILTDISGIEDAQGNMDFKVAGTRNGITSLQVDMKDIPGIPYHVFKEAIMKSRDARHRVLDIMDHCQASPRAELKENGPTYATIEVPPEKRRKLIGSGGHRIRALVSETGAEVRTVSEEQMSVFAPTREIMQALMERVEDILQEEEEREFEVGAIYPAVVRYVRDFGVIVELAPGVDVLLHKSQMSNKPISHPNELGLTVGQTINIKYYGRDPVTGRHHISRKAILTSPLDSGSETVVQTLMDTYKNTPQP